MFLVIVLSVWAAMHVYVASRLWNLPVAPGPWWHRGLVIAGVALWLSFPLGQFLARSIGRWAAPVEFVGAAWVGLLFVLLVTLLAADVVSGFGWLLPARPVRQVALVLAAALSAFGLTQGLRGPVVQEHRVGVRGLRPELEGLRIVQLSDVHLGPFLRSRWLERRLTQVDALRPDLIVVTGDLLDQDAALSESLVPWLQRLRARYGVWGVTGNHEFYAGLDRSLAVFRAANIRVLRDQAAEAAPGLVLAGVDDLTARKQFGLSDHPCGSDADQPAWRCDDLPLPQSMAGGARSRIGRGPDAVRPHARRPDLAVHLPGAADVPLRRRTLRGKRDDADRLAGNGLLGPADAAVQARGSDADHAHG